MIHHDRAPLVPRAAFTLVELLVVIAIIGILVALLLPAVQAARESARRTQCMNNMKQLSIACHQYVTARGKLPDMYFEATAGERAPQARGTLFFFLLPYLEQSAIYDTSTAGPWQPGFQDIIARVPIGDGAFQAPAARPLPAFLCPSDSTGPDTGLWPIWPPQGQFVNVGDWAFGNYAANYQVFANAETQAGIHYKNQRTILNLGTITDGTSNTIFFGERFRICQPMGESTYASLWAHGAWNMPYMPHFAYGNPQGTRGYRRSSGIVGVVGPDSLFQTVPQESPQCNPMMTQSIHFGVMLAGMGDGSVRAISADVSGTVWWSAVTPNEGEILGSNL